MDSHRSSFNSAQSWLESFMDSIIRRCYLDSLEKLFNKNHIFFLLFFLREFRFIPVKVLYTYPFFINNAETMFFKRWDQSPRIPSFTLAFLYCLNNITINYSTIILFLISSNLALCALNSTLTSFLKTVLVFKDKEVC